MKKLIGALALAASGAVGAAGGTATTSAPAAAEIERARHAFDFLHGDWTVQNRRQSDYANPDSPWETFSASNLVHALPAGIGNYDEYRPLGDWRPGFVAMTLRVFDPASGRWSIYWLTNRDGGLDPATGTLLPPVVGRFDADGVGRFEGEEVYKGRTARVRFTWTRSSERQARWEQAYSWDDGTSWQTNWIMDFTRR